MVRKGFVIKLMVKELERLLNYHNKVNNYNRGWNNWCNNKIC